MSSSSSSSSSSVIIIIIIIIISSASSSSSSSSSSNIFVMATIMDNTIMYITIIMTRRYTNVTDVRALDANLRAYLGRPTLAASSRLVAIPKYTLKL